MPLNELQALQAAHQRELAAVKTEQQQEFAVLKADYQHQLTLLKAPQESLRAELVQMQAAMATHTAALAGR